MTAQDSAVILCVARTRWVIANVGVHLEPTILEVLQEPALRSMVALPGVASGYDEVDPPTLAAREMMLSVVAHDTLNRTTPTECEANLEDDLLLGSG